MRDLRDALAWAHLIQRELRFDIASPFALAGRIYLLARTDDDHMLIVDWKAGEDTRDRSAHDHALQLDLCAAAVFTLYPDAAQITTT